jgi:hypothetical protein
VAVGDADDEFDANPYVVKELVGVDEDNVVIAVDTEVENAVVEIVKLVVLIEVWEEVEVNVSILLLDCP